MLELFPSSPSSACSKYSLWNARRNVFPFSRSWNFGLNFLYSCVSLTYVRIYVFISFFPLSLSQKLFLLFSSILSRTGSFARNQRGSTRFPKATGNASRRGRGGERWSLAVRIQGNWILALDTATRWRGRSSNASDLYRRDGSRCSVSTKPDRDLEMIEMSAFSIQDFRSSSISAGRSWYLIWLDHIDIFYARFSFFIGDRNFLRSFRYF